MIGTTCATYGANSRWVVNRLSKSAQGGHVDLPATAKIGRPVMAAIALAYCTGVVTSDGWTCPRISKTGKQNSIDTATENPIVRGRFVNNIIYLRGVKRKYHVRVEDSRSPSNVF